MKARPIKIRGESSWVVVLGKKEVGRRVRVFGNTKEQAMARGQTKLDELREHGHAQSGISATHRALIVEWRDRLTPEQMVAAFSAFDVARGCTRLVRESVADYIATKTKPDDRGRCAWSKEQEKPARSRLNRFVAAFGDKNHGRTHSRRTRGLCARAEWQRGKLPSRLAGTIRPCEAASLDREKPV